ncbi:hemolysin XhlA family protein [Brevibacillus parabrevis]|uniref:hemolysin XhlA family protein n=1 Tax=Brevibacillus parabrevis TaxID=54914 RepID=UPI001C225A92|nr:hemolysin XhlA family protein [Brevibacillus parabrevis]MBU8715379.1 hemolysin XhlA family protein [Brevibacillus parabrevis]
MADDLAVLVQDVRERLVRIETNLEQIIRDRERIDRADETARDALALASENARAIAEIKADDRRKWGAIGGMAASFIVSILIYFLTK